MYSIAFTGHRPTKLGGYDLNSKENRENYENLKSAIEEVVKTSGYMDFTFYFGGALGIDQMAFDAVYELRSKYPGYLFQMIVCVPFKLQDIKWMPESREKYRQQLDVADDIVYVDTEPGYTLKGIPVDTYHPAKMQKRNEYMVDNCDILIAVFDGTSGGTANCVKYAQKIGKEIKVIQPVKKAAP